MNVPGLNETNIGIIIRAIRDLARGASNALGRDPIVLAVGETETVVIDTECGDSSVPVLTPFSAAAATAGAFIKGVERGRFTIGHFAGVPGATFRYELRRP